MDIAGPTSRRGMAAIAAGLALVAATGDIALAQGAPPGIDDFVRRFRAAMDERNADSIAALYGERALLLMPEGPIAAGRDQIRAVYARNFASGTVKMTPAETRADGDASQAVILWIWNVEIAQPGRDPVRRRIRAMLHLKNGPAGWQIAADLYEVIPAG